MTLMTFVIMLLALSCTAWYVVGLVMLYRYLSILGNGSLASSFSSHFFSRRRRSSRRRPARRR